MSAGQKKKYTLMHENEPSLSFEIVFNEDARIFNVIKLSGFDNAFFGWDESENGNSLCDYLHHFLRRRSICEYRHDHQTILDITGCRSSVELAFKGHGLSLSDHFWYREEGEDLRYEDINFFENRWDDAFGRAVLNEDYESLRTADLNVPDIVTTGYAKKGWLCEEGGPTLCKLGIADGRSEECLGEVLASSMAKRLLKEGEALRYDLRLFSGRYASCSKAMIGLGEEMVPLSCVLPEEMKMLYKNKNMDRKNNLEFFARLKEFDYLDLTTFFTKLMCLRTLCFVHDLHFENISLIRNFRTGSLRIAPIYDLAGSFGSGETGKKLLSNLSQSNLLLIYFLYGNLEESWDYSWYDPSKLEGFEEEIRETLSKSDFYTPSLIENIVSAYRSQKESLDKMKQKHSLNSDRSKRFAICGSFVR